jgi:hypothetical protein
MQTTLKYNCLIYYLVFDRDDQFVFSLTAVGSIFTKKKKEDDDKLLHVQYCWYVLSRVYTLGCSRSRGWARMRIELEPDIMMYRIMQIIDSTVLPGPRAQYTYSTGIPVAVPPAGPVYY